MSCLTLDHAVEQYNKKRKEIEFQVGDLVYVNRKNGKTRRPSPKLDTRFAGPLLRIERIGSRAYRLRLPAELWVNDVFHVSLLERTKSSLTRIERYVSLAHAPSESDTGRSSGYFSTLISTSLGTFHLLHPQPAP